MTTRLLFGLSFCFLGIMFPQARCQDAPGLLECVVALKVPEYPPLARYARLTGTGVTTIRIGERGAVAEVRVEDVHSGLAKEIQRAMKASEFAPACAGRTVTARFTFELMPPPSHEPGFSVVFRPPDHFVVAVRVPLLYTSSRDDGCK